MEGALKELYQKYAPRWFKVIKWNRMGNNFLYNQRFHISAMYIPAILYYVYWQNHYAIALAWYKPQTEEERMELKRDAPSIRNQFARDWEMGQYSDDQPPKYDVFERRRKYPEHYGDKYETFKKYTPY